MAFCVKSRGYFRLLSATGSRIQCRYKTTIYRADGTAAKQIKEEMTPLTKHIRDTILATGPISIAQYMQLALTSPVGGYYTRGQVFGREGDFVTSPDISQMFGEIMAVWYIMQWEAMGRPPKTAFLELGPGKGTLMDDMLRAAKRFPSFFKTIQTVHLVEKSPQLRRLQHDRLKCDQNSTALTGDKNDTVGTPADSMSTSHGGIKVRWYDLLEEIELTKECMPMVMAHEFFDALPIYKFVKGSDNRWHEILVDVATDTTTGSNSSSHFQYVKAPKVTSNAAMLLKDQCFTSLFSEGDSVEVSPEAARIMIQLSNWITSNRGLGLVIDYGQDWTQGETFRGIKNHKFANPLGEPGSMDLTADVDFSYLRFAAMNRAQCYGPIEQGLFLHAMGIHARLKQLLDATSDEKTKTTLVDSYKRLTESLGMGRIYKVMAIGPKDAQGQPIPFSSAK